MALIQCPECGNSVSSAAISCPKCGYPIAKTNLANTDSTNQVNNDDASCNNEPPFPELPTIIDVGKQLSLFTVPEVKAHYVAEINSTNYIKEGEVNVAARTNGLSFHFELKSFMISYDQIVEIKSFSHTQLKGEKSVIDRAAAGWLLLGPAGAVVGGLSGLGSKKVGNYLLSIVFWDIYTHKMQTLLLCTKSDSTDFIRKVEAEKRKKNQPTDGVLLCNILDEKGEISDAKVVEVLNSPAKYLVLDTVKLINGGDEESAKQKLDEICERNNLDKSEYKLPGGCMVTLLLMMTGLMSFMSIIFIV